MRRGFTLLELLVVVAIVSLLAAILFPALASAKASAKQSVCLANLRSIGVAMNLYLADWDDRMPDRRDLKSTLAGGYRPWTSWPPSDPRSGWAGVLLADYKVDSHEWSCPSLVGTTLGEAVQVRQEFDPDQEPTRFWMWRFDRMTDPIPLDNFWGKTPDQAVSDLRAANNPAVGKPEGTADTELAVDPYFPRTIPSVEAGLKGLSAHRGGRNRLFLDLHAKFVKDRRLNP